MVDIREDLRQQTQIEEALQHHSKNELIEMMSNLLKTYVIDGVRPHKPDVGRVHIPQTLRGLDFVSLIETLKFHLDLPDLEKFNIVDGQVYVKLGNSEYALDGPAPARPAPPPPVSAAPPSRPAAQSPAPTPSAPPPAAAPPTPAPKPAAPAPIDDRFRMLELD